MTTTTLQNFGVPLGGGSGRGGILQPKTKWKFRVIATNFGIPTGSISLTQQIMTCGRPKATFDPQTVDSYNSRAYFAGKASWDTITIKLRDDVTNAVESLVGAQLQKQMNFINQTTPLSASNYKFQLLIDTLDGGDDTVLEEWFLEGCFVTDYEFDEFDYSASEAMTISLTIRFDNATLQDGLMPVTPILTTTDAGFIA